METKDTTCNPKSVDAESVQKAFLEIHLAVLRQMDQVVIFCPDVSVHYMNSSRLNRNAQLVHLLN